MRHVDLLTTALITLSAILAAESSRADVITFFDGSTSAVDLTLSSYAESGYSWTGAVVGTGLDVSSKVIDLAAESSERELVLNTVTFTAGSSSSATLKLTAGGTFSLTSFRIESAPPGGTFKMESDKTATPVTITIVGSPVDTGDTTSPVIISDGVGGFSAVDFTEVTYITFTNDTTGFSTLAIDAVDVTTAVPEPSSLLLQLGAAPLLLRRRREQAA
jgi:hypothetical protein